MIKASIYKPITMLMVVLVFVVFGMYTYRMLPVNMLPDFDIPYVTAVVVYSGASPEELISSVIKVAEEDLELIDGIDYVQSYAMENYAIFLCAFDMSVDVDVAANDVRDKIETAATDFPDEVEDPTISKIDINASAIITIALTGDVSATELRTRADDRIKPLLASSSGVASVDLFGGATRQINVDLNAEAIQARGVSISTIMSILAAANLNYPGGEIDGKHKNTTVRLSSKFTSIDDIMNLEIPTSSGIIHLNEIATVKDTTEEATSASRFNGKNAVLLSVKKRTDANTIEVVDGVLARMEQINKDLPEGFELSVSYDSSTSIRNSVNNVITNLMLAIVLTSALLLLFLGRLSTMFIAAITMPVSVVGAFTFMYFAGFTINVMTLMALSSATGLLVTNAIVVLENITKYLELGYDPKEASYKGTSEIMVAIMSSTLTNVCVFVPIAFMKSTAGSMFRSFGLTMVFATFVSLLTTFTLTPLMAAYLFKGRERDANGELLPEKKSILGKIIGVFPWTLNLVKKVYLWTLNIILSPIGFVIEVAAMVFLLGAVAGLAKARLSVEMMPNADEGVIKISFEMPVGTNLEATDDVVKNVLEKRIQGIPELKRYSVEVGGEEGMSTVNEASLTITLVDRKQRTRTTNQIVDSLRVVLADVPDAYISIKSSSASSMNGGQADVQFEISGFILDSVIKASELAMTEVAKIPGVVDVKSSYEAGKPEIQFHPNRKAMADYGYTAAEAGATLYYYLSGYEATRYTDPADDEEYSIYLQLREEDRDTKEKVLNLPIQTSKGFVPITALFDTEQSMAPTTLQRKRKMYLVVVEMNLLPGYTTGAAMSAISANVPKLEGMPEDISFSFGGSADMQNDMVDEFITAILMAILLTYILLVALLESFAQPFIIMTTIPMGAIGVVLALSIAGMSLSIIAFFAIVMLIGVVVNNAILLLDEANRLLRSGTMGRRSSIMNAADAKFMPIALATVASIAAQVPLGLGLGEGSEMTQPMGVASIGGLAISAILTMYLIPTFFWLPNALFRKGKKASIKVQSKIKEQKKK